MTVITPLAFHICWRLQGTSKETARESIAGKTVAFFDCRCFIDAKLQLPPAQQIIDSADTPNEAVGWP
jgi:hypothetical protein